MAGKIPREFIDELLLRVDIVDLIDLHVPLKKAGNSFKARCPFHTEKSPSFSVNRNKQFYHCFGCGVGGNAISFLMEFSHLDFVEAIEDLAGFAGIEVPREARQYQGNKQEYSGLYLILERVAVFYVEQLRHHVQGNKAIEYLKSRGLSGEIAKQFSLGYAPDDWSILSSKFDIELLINAGMVVAKDNGGRYDRFRGRLVFPIRDKRNRIVGFGGRVLDDSMPKYLNSPETAIFSKGKELYGLFELLEKQSKPERIIIVEGYMDVLALAQFGIHYSVAALGTATSKNHLDLLFRFTSEIVFCFDGDTAGQNATWKAVQESFPCLKDGRQIRIMLLPDGQDPDSLVREDGVTGFEKRLHDSQMLSDYFIEFLGQELNLATLEGQSQIISRAKPHVEKIPNGIFREKMIAKLNELSDSTALDVLAIQATIDREITSNTATFQIKPIKPEHVVLALLIQNPEMAEIIEEFVDEWDEISFKTKNGLLAVLDGIEINQPRNTGGLLEAYRDDTEKHEWLTRLANTEVIPFDNDDFDIKEAFVGALKRVIELGKKQYINELLEKNLN
ncbi:MAG: DNA primase [Methylococcales symbiont of Hymedesmia sp. n. MRB-2018]|nr:MAG: DNA primase [Methylococcales symbiont of Hymedesmia sp. n. MRB-2018]